MKGIGHICTTFRLETQTYSVRAGYAFPRGPGLPHSEVLASQRGNETQDYRGDMNVPGIRTVVPTHREHYWQEREVEIPLRGTPEGGGVGNIITP
jgi:hypothetical protein